MAFNADSLKEFFLKQVVLPRMFLVDVPGYVLGSQGSSIFIRNLFLSEPFFVSLEKRVSDKFGEEGLAKLYGVGKKLGYRFCALTNIPRSDIKFSVKMCYDFVESIYADRLLPDIDMEDKVITVDTENLVVTRINGSGLPVMIGGTAGIWGYLLNDFNSIECGIIRKSDGNYMLISAPAEKLKEMGIKFYESHGIPNMNDKPIYTRFNQPPSYIPPNVFNTNKMMHMEPFYYDKGPLKYALPHSRLLSIEIFLPYELETLFGDQMVYETAKESFAIIGKNIPRQANIHTYLANILTGMGLGIVTAEKGPGIMSFVFSGTPWYETASKSTFPLLRGAIAGFIEGQGNPPIKASYFRSELHVNTLRVVIDVQL